MTSHETDQPSVLAALCIELLPDLQEVLVHQTNDMEAIYNNGGLRESSGDTAIRLRLAGCASAFACWSLWQCMQAGRFVGLAYTSMPFSRSTRSTSGSVMPIILPRWDIGVLH